MRSAIAYAEGHLYVQTLSAPTFNGDSQVETFHREHTAWQRGQTLTPQESLEFGHRIAANDTTVAILAASFEDAAVAPKVFLYRQPPRQQDRF